MKEFNGEVLKNIRTQLGWTQSELASALMVSLSSVQKWEASEAPIKRKYWPVIVSSVLSTPFADLLRQGLVDCFGEAFVASVSARASNAA